MRVRALARHWFRHSGDIWGGLAAMLVALPAAVAFGVTVYAAIGAEYAASGALAGILGATALGLLAPTLGGTDRLISAPCAPAAAVLSAFAIELVQQGVAAPSIVLMMAVLGILTGLIQIFIGFMGVGKLIRYIPHPVVSGYLSAVGLIIIGSQLPKLLGAPVLSPHLWDVRNILIGVSTITVMLFAAKLTKIVPATIVGMVAGGVAYLILAMNHPLMLQLEGNKLVIGSLGASIDGYVGLLTKRWFDIGELKLSQIAALLGSALTLAALLSIDTLKTCVVLDQMTRTRHDPNRELTAQGLGNILASAVGGMPGAGTMGASLINLSSGAKTRISGILEGVFSLVAALLLGAFIAWIPVATLSGVLLVIGLRMMDTQPLRYLESRSTVLDFLVVLAVIVVALTVGLIAASATGVVLSIILFLREQVGGNVIRRKSLVNQRSSTWYRPEAEMRILAQKGTHGMIIELQGSLFFGTTHQFFLTLEPELRTRDYIILDFQRVQSVDLTAAHTLVLIRDILHERHATLLLSNVREVLPNGRNLREFLKLSGVTGSHSHVKIMPTLESAIEWVEDKLIGSTTTTTTNNINNNNKDTPLELHQMELFQGRKDETLQALENCMEHRTWKAGESIYRQGDAGNSLYFIRSGEVRLWVGQGYGLPMHHIASFGQGDFFGGLAFLDGHPRGNDAIAHQNTEAYMLTLEKFNELAETHRMTAYTMLFAIARTLATRLRYADDELVFLQKD